MCLAFSFRRPPGSSPAQAISARGWSARPPSGDARPRPLRGRRSHLWSRQQPGAREGTWQRSSHPWLDRTNRPDRDLVLQVRAAIAMARDDRLSARPGPPGIPEGTRRCRGVSDWGAFLTQDVAWGLARRPWAPRTRWIPLLLTHRVPQRAGRSIRRLITRKGRPRLQESRLA